MIGVYIWGIIIGAVIVFGLGCSILLVHTFRAHYFPLCYFCGKREKTKAITGRPARFLGVDEVGYHPLCLKYALDTEGYEHGKKDNSEAGEVAMYINVELSFIRVKAEDKQRRKEKYTLNRFAKEVRHSQYQELAGEKGLDFIIEKDKEEVFDRRLH